MDTRFVLLDSSPSLVEEWEYAFHQHLPDTTRVKFIQSWLNNLQPPDLFFDCIVSPANSYGRMDGGFDEYLSQALSPDDLLAPTRITQRELYRRWRGYAPPGTCTLIPLQGTECAGNRHNCSFIALCPTMRTPGFVSWNREIVYNCVWSLLNAISEHNRLVYSTGSGSKIRTVLMTGMATGDGGVPPERCAQQMALAFKHFEDASANPEKWSSLEWGIAIDCAQEVRATYRA